MTDADGGGSGGGTFEVNWQDPSGQTGNQAPTASIHSVSATNTGGDTYEVTVDWSATDPDGNLDTGTITVEDGGPASNTETASISSAVSGSSSSGTETLTITLSGPPPKSYDVTLTITDTEGASDTDQENNNNPREPGLRRVREGDVFRRSTNY
ncbi:hypothetical protein BRC83_03860 [Halobacteriales archaeon QS_1_68_17]|nr:MAG: hypothetical protein BRC83_03860 [Halobacteriales archaeon QS_1_68_17]